MSATNHSKTALKIMFHRIGNSNLTNSYSCGHDNINNTLLKSISNEISSCITLIINQFISTGCYPENLKLAKVIYSYF